MELPREPTTIPQARKYSRKFEAPRTKTYGEQETFMINIPPINHTYMTKNVKLHFDFNLDYYESTQTTATNIAKYCFSDHAEEVNNIEGFFDRSNRRTRANMYTKPFPTFDINGAYGLISRIRVYDFLGTTLLEDVQEHDLLTAMLADFDLKSDNLNIIRPTIIDSKLMPNDTVQYGVSHNTDTVRKPPCSFITNDYDYRLNSSWTLSQFQLNPSTETATIIPGKVSMSNHFSIDLYSFLGKLSDKFTPLHNGFRIEFTINKSDIPISFNTGWGNNMVHFKPSNHSDDAISVVLDPYIENMQLSNIYIKADLLEISPELDKGIDKMVHYQGFKYQRDEFSYSDFSGGTHANTNRPDFTKRITPAYKSISSVYIGQRMYPHKNYTQNLGFRVKNYLGSAELLFNKSVIQSIDNDQEAIDAFNSIFNIGCDDYITKEDFLLDEPDNYNGTGLCQFSFVNNAGRDSITSDIETYGGDYMKWWPGFYGNSDPFFGENLPIVSWSPRTSFFQGKYLLAFDTKIPGTTSDVVAGIDTTKNVLEYKFKCTETECLRVLIDVFCQHDCFLRIDPGKSTTVSF